MSYSRFSKILASFLAISICLSLVSCRDSQDSPASSPTPQSTSEAPFSATPCDETYAPYTGEDTPYETETYYPTVPSYSIPTPTELPSFIDYDLPQEDGKLIYYEDFDSYYTLNEKSSAETVMKALGWKIDTVENGAPHKNTANYSIKKYGNSKQLYIDNNRSGCGDSYVVVLSSALFGIYHEQNYTYQYDICYTGASNSQRYINLISEYNGEYYNTFHLRNNGTGNNEFCRDNVFSSYDAGSKQLSATATDENAIIKKILGADLVASKQNLNGISLSVRYVNDWESGNSIYIRVNTPGYVGSDKWTLVSKYAPKDVNEAPTITPFIGGAAIALKIGGCQNGYLDNIMVWLGTEEQPDNLSQKTLTGHETECSGHRYTGVVTCTSSEKCVYCNHTKPVGPHNYVDVPGTDDRICSVCKTYKSNESNAWMLRNIPCYDGGIYSANVYYCGNGLETSFPKNDQSAMMIVSGTKLSEFKTYCSKLIKYGYKQIKFTNSYGNYYSLHQFSDGSYIYAYLTVKIGEVRIIHDKHSNTTAEQISYTYAKKSTDTTVLYQYGLPYDPLGRGYTGGGNYSRVNCGMFYILKLPDNSVFLIDGGYYFQFDDAEIDGLMPFLREITGIKTGKIRISGWYITHGHPDHMSGLCLFFAKYHDNFTLERMFFNFPSVYSNDSTYAGARSDELHLMSYINKYFDMKNIKYLKIHTGEEINLAGTKITILYTHEDIVNPLTGLTEANEDFNNSSCVARFDFDGSSFLLTGDINVPAMNILLENTSTGLVECDVLQIAHHCLNDTSKLVRLVNPIHIFYPQSLVGITALAAGRATVQAVNEVINPGYAYFAADGTVGLQVVDGVLTKVYTRPVDGGDYTDWYW